MKPLSCEICGSTDLVKQESMFVCQSCGIKYSVEDIKKVMIEVSGTVTLDSSTNLDHLYHIARLAKDDNYSKNAAKYYTLILQEDPLSWEAWFYSVYCLAANASIDQIQPMAVEIKHCIYMTLKLLKENIMDEGEKKKAIIEVYSQIITLCNTMYRVAKDHYKQSRRTTNNAANAYIHRETAVVDTLGYLGLQIEQTFGEDEDLCNLAVSAWKEAVDLHKAYMYAFYPFMQNNDDAIMPYIKKIEEYEAPHRKAVANSGCYIATCVYGSYDCPQVWTLRRFRDDKLAATPYGRAFIHTYYTISPLLVKCFGGTQWFQKIGKTSLNLIVSKLQKRGTKSTPYKDHIS